MPITITVEYLKQFGDYNGYSEERKAYMYTVQRKKYLWNGQGITRLY